MKPLSTLLAFALFTACDVGDPEDDPVPAPVEQELVSEPPVPDVSRGPQPFALGAWTATLDATDETLSVTAVDEHGEAVAPFGELRVWLTGTGEEEQRLVLAAGDEGWSGAARAAGASGYVAVVGVEVGGERQTARVAWGEVPGP